MYRVSSLTYTDDFTNFLTKLKFKFVLYNKKSSGKIKSRKQNIVLKFLLK